MATLIATTTRNMDYQSPRAVMMDHFNRANYYIWSARRMFHAHGRDPITGQSWESMPVVSRLLHQAQAKASARIFLSFARKQRLKWHDTYIPKVFRVS
jgi:hypothetical protein